MGRLSNLRADINSGTISKPADVLSAAYSIEGELVAWLAGLPPTFSYYTVSSDLLESTFKEKCRGILPYNNKYHVYRTFWVCNAWNQYRTARILTNEIILGYLKGIFNAKSEGSMASNFQTQLDTIRNTIRELAIEICSSVPYHFGAGGIDGTEGWSPPPESYIGGYVLLWPLFLAGMTEKEGHPMRKWAADCLTVVGRSMGVDQALALVDIMGMENYFEETDPGNEPVLGSGCETAA